MYKIDYEYIITLSVTTGVTSFFFSSSFITENVQFDEGYFPAHAWHDNFFFINFHFLQIFINFQFYNFFFFFLFSIR